MEIKSNNVVIIAVGASEYNNNELEYLDGPLNDVQLIKKLLTESKETAYYDKHNFYEIIDKDTQYVKNKINEIIKSLNSEISHIIFYFSGHGAPIVQSYDFALCLKDTDFHPRDGIVLPLSVLTFSDLLKTFVIANITPIIIIDACYSGMATRSLEIKGDEIYGRMTGTTVTEGISNSELLLSSRSYQQSQDGKTASLFTNYLNYVASEGLIKFKKKPTLSLGDIYPEIKNKIENYSKGFSPIHMQTNTLVEFPFVVNAKYDPPKVTFSLQSKGFLLKLYNGGNPKYWDTNRIRKLFADQAGIYSNYSKLSYSGWSLIEKHKEGSKQFVMISKRGIDFISGNLEIPKRIIRDYKADPHLEIKDQYIPDPNTEWININSVN